MTNTTTETKTETTTTATMRPFGLYVASPRMRVRLAALAARYGYDEVYPITESEHDDDTAVVLRADTDGRLYLTPSPAYTNVDRWRWPLLYDVRVMRIHEVTESGLYPGLVVTLGDISDDLDSASKRLCDLGCGMRITPATVCCWCMALPPMLPLPDSPDWSAVRAEMRAMTVASRRECQKCGHNAGTDPLWHSRRFGHQPVVAGPDGQLFEYDGTGFTVPIT